MAERNGMEATTTHLILYDGVCGLCSRVTLFILPRDSRGIFRFAAIQSATGRRTLESFGRNPDDLDTFFVVPSYESETPALLDRADAALFVASHLNWPWRLVRFLRFLPHGLLDWGYGRIAKSRYKIFGRYETCMIPSPAFRDRFVDP